MAAYLALLSEVGLTVLDYSAQAKAERLESLGSGQTSASDSLRSIVQEDHDPCSAKSRVLAVDINTDQLRTLECYH